MSGTEDRSRQLRVLIVDRHEVSRAAIRALLQTEGLEVVADVSTGDRALVLAPRVSPDVAIVDIGRGEPPALEVARSLARLPSPPIVVLVSSTPIEGGLDGYRFLAKADICAQQLRMMAGSRNHNHQERPMSMQAYLDNITAKTGKTPEELGKLAEAKGLVAPGVKPKQIIAWLKEDYGLGHGHAMAIVATIKKSAGPQPSAGEKVARHFAGKKAAWRPVYDRLVEQVGGFGPDTDVAPGASYLSLRRAGKKFAIVQVTAERLDIGLKLRGVAADGRLESAGSWNTMVTHRVRIHRPADVDGRLLDLLEQAYTRA